MKPITGKNYKEARKREMMLKYINKEGEIKN
jgi:hypothetical protein